MGLLLVVGRWWYIRDLWVSEAPNAGCALWQALMRSSGPASTLNMRTIFPLTAAT